MRIHTLTLLLVTGLAVIVTGCGDENASASGKVSTAPGTPAASEEAPPGQGVDTDVGLESRSAAKSSPGQVGEMPESQSLPTTAAAPLRYLPVEQRFIRQNALSVEDAGQAMKSAHFDQVVNALEREAARDRDAQEVSNLYKAEATKAVPADGRLVNVACGLSVCMGSIRAPSEASLSQWSSKFGESKRAPSYSQINYTKQIGPHEYESRFMFSTDPSADSLSGRLPVGR